MLNQFRVPFVKMWSPSFVPKPDDWGDHIDVVGAFFVDQSSGKDKASSFTPPQRLVQWLASGEAPVFIGFGSMVIEDTQALAGIIVAAAEKVGCRIIVQSSWSTMNGITSVEDADEGVLERKVVGIGRIPHDWLMPQMCAVVHHGGAGTVAAGLRAGKPTFVCPFFGDQFFWVRRCACTCDDAVPFMTRNPIQPMYVCVTGWL